LTAIAVFRRDGQRPPVSRHLGGGSVLSWIDVLDTGFSPARLLSRTRLLKPAASWFPGSSTTAGRGGAATTLVFAIFLVLFGAFVGAAIPPLAQQAGELIHEAPH